MHRERRRHVATDLAPYALLGAGEAIGQRGPKPAHEIAGRIERDAARACRTRAQDRQAELEEQEVVEGEAAVRRRQRVLILREVSVAQCHGQRGQSPACSCRLGKDLGHAVSKLLDDAPHEPSESALMQAFGRGVHGHQPAGV
ncbi:MAG: hypothetical protein AUG80_07595 [Candidatus Rokubacteria bacterium 13_1_20CM_4_68_9]|nr:MAG: hypothetical protein AUG80_07595 [Candidatus Rokubacteria bacterium 13_1_20CM_4_68_9]